MNHKFVQMKLGQRTRRMRLVEISQLCRKPANRPCFRHTTRGPLWGYLKVNFSETLSIFGDKRPRNGSKNEEMAPRTKTGYPHIGPFVGDSQDQNLVLAFR